MRRALVVLRFTGSLGAIALVTVLFNRGFTPTPRETLGVNPTTVALTYLVVILVIAIDWGITEATAASVLAVISFNFFFLPPVGTFTIADPQNWVAFVAFLITAILTSQLSGRARQRTIEAVDRQRDLERLYALSRALLLIQDRMAAGSAIAKHIADAFQFAFVGILDQQAHVAWTGDREMRSLDPVVRDVARRSTIEHQGGAVIMPVQLGGMSIGAMAIPDVGVSDTVAHSLTNLAAIGLERARSHEATARAEAAQQSGELRAVVLDALAHEFKTPLTSMKGAASALATGHTLTGADREMATVLVEGIDRLQELISDAVHMLRVDAGQFILRPERLRLGDVVSAALARFKDQLDDHEVITDVPASLTVDADRELLGLALRQLVDNAVKYSSHRSRIAIRAAANGTVRITVTNFGSVIAPADLDRIFDRFYRSTTSRQVAGTGMGLAIVRQIAQAHRGEVTAESSADTGTSVTLALPKESSTA